MKHPDNSDWMSYLYDECEVAEWHRLKAHLEQCPTCRERVARWQGVQVQLDTDTALLARPTRVRGVLRFVPHLLAAAALVVVGVGIGRWTGPGPADIRREVAGMLPVWEARWRAERLAADQALAQATVDAQQQWVETLRAEWAAGRTRDWALMETALDRVDRRQRTESLALRAGLLRLAGETGSGFSQTENHLNQLVSYLPDNSNETSRPTP
jgi:anti-sigma factor RsiW